MTRGPHSGAHGRWDVRAGVTIPAADHGGRERLLRYLARAPLSLERMSLMPDGRIAYELRHAWRAGRTHVLLEPMQLLARLAAIVPPPRHPLLRFHGAFAPNAPWRKHVVPTVPPRLAAAEAATGAEAVTDAQRDLAAPCRHANPSATSAAQSPPGVVAGGAPTGAPPGATADLPRGRAAPSSAHARWYIDWATLLKRVYDVNALACACGGKLKFIEIVDNERDARAVLAVRGAALGVDTGAAPDPDMARDFDKAVHAMRCADGVHDIEPAPADDPADALRDHPDCDLIDELPDYEASEPPPDSS